MPKNYLLTPKNPNHLQVSGIFSCYGEKLKLAATKGYEPDRANNSKGDVATAAGGG